jgi:asparagine synthase (glutamine-hydrolysing)
MAAAIRHRGPDGEGFYVDQSVGLANVRLSIVDVKGGGQPIANEDGRLQIVYNGEVYNYRELRRELEARGHRYRTQTDTEVLVHAYEEWGEEMLERLNGQFAFAIYDRRDESLFFARDRFGVRPLFFAERGDALYFASECKAFFASGAVEAEPDFIGLDQVFTFWGARAPRTVFRDITSLEPGCCARWRGGRLTRRRYYSLEYPTQREDCGDVLARLDDTLRSSVGLRMRADVPVGGYLSGGLDSSITCAVATALSPHPFRTFSVTFDDPQFDERAHQELVARTLGSRHAGQAITPTEIAQVFPDVVRHAETPLVRSAPAPLFLLSRLTRDTGIKVVLTGEGADELFFGYDLFKETVVRLFCLRRPHSSWRPRLFDRLYPYLGPAGRGGEFWRRFFLDAGSPDDPLFSHQPRFLLTARIKEFYNTETREALRETDALDELRQVLPPDFARWSPLHRAAYLEMITLLEPYLLSSQGDRMALAHSVEGRFPFLDHRLFELAAALPERHKLCGLKEKAILKRWARAVVPPAVRQRAKQPYRAPDAPAFFGLGAREYVEERLSPAALRDVGMFEPRAVAALVARCRSGAARSARENQALIALLSTQLWYDHFITPARAVAEASHG